MSKAGRWFRSMPVLILAGVLHGSAKSQTTSINIRSAIDLALANNYTLKADSLNNQVARDKVSIAKADFLPQVNFYNKMEYNAALPSQMLPGKVIGQPDRD